MSSQYSVLRELGRGASGVVSLVRRRSDGRLFAAKEIMFADLNERRSILEEVHLMQSLPQHPSLLGLEEVIEGRSSVTMILEYSSEGTLRDYLYSQPMSGGDQFEVKDGLSEDEVLRFLTQLVNALHFLHSNDILHRDLKLENLLLFSKCSVVKISDFGVATILGRSGTGSERMAQTTTGTPHYMSPEVCEGHPYNYKSDVWSLGIAVYEMCTRELPFQAANLLALAGKICHQATPQLPMTYSRRLNAIVKAMLTKNQTTRPSMKDVANMLQYNRRRRAEGAADGEDLGGFQVDSFVVPSDFDEEVDPVKGKADKDSWGPPSLKGLDDDDMWGDDDAEFDTAGGLDADIYTTNDQLNKMGRSPLSTKPQQQAYNNGSFDDRKGVQRQQELPASPQRRVVTDDLRGKIFEEGRKQAAENKRRVQEEERRKHNDDEEASPARSSGNRSPKLRGLIEELQLEMRRQAARVEQMYNPHAVSPSPPPQPLLWTTGAPIVNDIERRSESQQGNSSWMSSQDVQVEHFQQQQQQFPSDGRKSLPSTSNIIDTAGRLTPPPQKIQPFVDPAGTPSAVRKGSSPVPTPPPSQLKNNSLPPSAFSTAVSASFDNTPMQSTSALVFSPKDESETLPAKKLPTASVGGKQPAPTPKNTPINPPQATPRSNSINVPSSPASSPLRARAQSFRGGDNKEPYYPPCAQCLKAAKERRTSVAAMDTSTNSQMFQTINPSRFYCSTCHAPLCLACHQAVHDPSVCITNLQPPTNGALATSLKRHNIFYLSVTDPTVPTQPVPSAAPQPLSINVSNSSFGNGGGPSSPSNRRSVVTIHDPASGEEGTRDESRADRLGGGCCAVM